MITLSVKILLVLMVAHNIVVAISISTMHDEIQKLKNEVRRNGYRPLYEDLYQDIREAQREGVKE